MDIRPSVVLLLCIVLIQLLAAKPNKSIIIIITPWGRGPSALQFWGVPYTLYRRSTKFDVKTYGDGTSFRGQPRPTPKGRSTSAFQFGGFLSIYAHTRFADQSMSVPMSSNNFERRDARGRNFRRISRRTYSCCLTQNDRIRDGNTSRGTDVFLGGQPLHPSQGTWFQLSQNCAGPSPLLASVRFGLK